MKHYFRELSVLGALLAILLGLAIFAPAFYQPQPLLSLLTREAPTLVVACGMALVIVCRQIDISVGSIFSVCSVCAGLLAARGWPLLLVLPASVALGAVFGAFNGVLVAGLRLPSIVVTLATMVTLRQGLNLVRQGEFVNLPEGIQWFLVFVSIGALTGLAAMMNLAQSPQVQPLTGNGLELKVIAAVVVGGVAISGGRGNLWGAFAGLLLLACISPALTHLRIEAYWEKAIQGTIILLAVVADGLRSRKGGN